MPVILGFLSTAWSFVSGAGKAIGLVFASLPRWLQIGIVAAVALALWTWWVNDRAYDRGYAARDSEWQEAVKKAQDAAKAKETEWQTKISLIQSDYEKELSDAKTREDQLRADVDAGKRSLRIKAACPRVSDNPSAAGSGDDTAVELSATARQTYFELRQAIITDTATLKACQDYARAISGR